MNCVCGREIPEARAKLIDEGKVPRCCVDCSDVTAYSGMMVFSHKTAPEIAIINNDARNADEVKRLANRANKRSR